MTFTEKINAAPTGSFHVLDPVKAKKMKAKTMYIPSPADIRDIINSIPSGQTWTLVQVRNKLADDNNAETTCPAATTKYWKWLAFAAEEEGTETLPWWRITKEGKPSDLLPGGTEKHRALLMAEGFAV